MTCYNQVLYDTLAYYILGYIALQYRMNMFSFPAFFRFLTTKGAFSPDPQSFSPHEISKFRVCHETLRDSSAFRVCPPPVY